MWVAVAKAAVTGLLSLLAKLAGPLLGYIAGRIKAKADAAEKGLDHAKRAREIDEDVARLPDAALDDELRGKP
jgi:hypothetical protein